MQRHDGLRRGGADVSNECVRSGCLETFRIGSDVFKCTILSITHMQQTEMGRGRL